MKYYIYVNESDWYWKNGKKYWKLVETNDLTKTINTIFEQYEYFDSDGDYDVTAEVRSEQGEILAFYRAYYYGYYYDNDLGGSIQCIVHYSPTDIEAPEPFEYSPIRDYIIL